MTTHRASPRVRHRRRMLAWLILTTIALAVVLATSSAALLDGRHLVLVGAVLGLVFESEWTR